MKPPRRTQKAGAVTARSPSLQRMVRRCGPCEKAPVKKHRRRPPLAVISAALKKLRSGHERILNVLRRPEGLRATELLLARVRSLIVEADRLGQPRRRGAASGPKTLANTKRIQSDQSAPKRASLSQSERRLASSAPRPSQAKSGNLRYSYKGRVASPNDPSSATADQGGNDVR